MLSERLGSEEHPFCKARLENTTEFLHVLGLTTESTADDARRTAISMRREMQEKGLNDKSVKALKWALESTRDCISERELLWFLLDDYSFEAIASSRVG